MKLKTLFLTSLLCGSVITGIASPALAIEGSADGKGAKSTAEIELIPGDTDVVTPPTNPTTPPGDIGNKGPLTIDYVTPLLFKTQKLDGKEQVYVSTVDDANVQVTDKRGEEAGWTLRVSKTPFTDTTDATKVLKGAKLILPVGTLTQALTSVSVAPLLNSLEIKEDPATLMVAKTGAGAGTWTNVFKKEEVTLTVPAGNKVGEYVSTITWSLLDAPE
ncbi:WxL domain-containing protein [Carnobacterium maltaromaticum]|uniref:WxL domain-containing protein n=1 Tax=Carnobacterium maltaromaticum TaxID=2751 RepID=UPI00295E31BD|nr:WxL domain-containing protein [Carnobacterium maltaromaticum]